MKKTATSAAPILLLILTAIIFGRSLAFDFVRWDDQDLVSENALLKPPTAEHLTQFWKRPFAGLYTPVAYTAWSGAAMFAGAENGSLDPHLFHAWNVLLHLASVGLVYSILRKVINKPWAAFAGAAVFAWHPMQVEAVAWVSGMNNLLAGALGLGAIRFYLAYRDAEKFKWFALATILFTLALLSKPTAVVIPIIAWILGRLTPSPCTHGEGGGEGEFERRTVLDRQNHPHPSPLPEYRARGPEVPLVSWMLLAVIEIVITRIVQPAGSVARVALWRRPIVALDAVGYYLWKLFVPVRMSTDYGRTPQRIWDSHGFYWTIAIVILVGIVIAMCRRLVPALLIFVLALLPVLGLVSFDFQKYSTVADRYAYLAMLGPALAMAYVASQKAGKYLAVGVSVILLVLTALQLGIWQNSETLVAHVLAIDPGSGIGNTIRAAELSRTGHPDQAIAFYDVALARQPNDAALHYNLGNALLATGQLDRARDEYLTAIPLLRKDLVPKALDNLEQVDREKQARAKPQAHFP
jgi:hypothetical protein